MLVRGLIVLCPPKLILSLKVTGGRKRTADYLAYLEKLVLLFGGLTKLLDMSTHVPKVKEFFPWKKLLRKQNSKNVIVKL